jgi:hypothetical protein
VTNPHLELIDLLADTYRPFGWNDRSADGYLVAIGDLPIEHVRVVVIAAIRSDSRMPAAADLRRAVLELVDGPTPLADEAWAEVARAFGTHGRPRTPDWSTPTVADTVAALGGWQRLCGSDPAGLRIQFVRTYAQLAQRAQREALTAPALGELFVGRHLDELEEPDHERWP